LFQNSNKRNKKRVWKNHFQEVSKLGEKKKILGYLQIEEERERERERERRKGGGGGGARAICGVIGGRFARPSCVCRLVSFASTVSGF
jgi:hypothetical protein